jgi:hypothetical protein
MRRLLPVLALALLALPVRGEEKPPDPLEAPTAQAVEKGVAYLLSEQERNGSWSGEAGPTALVLLALHRSGLREGHPRFDRGLRWLRHSTDGRDRTYETSLRLMLLVEVDPRKHRRRIQKLALRLVMSQCLNGQWTYKAVPGKRKKQGDNSNSQFALLALWMARYAGVPVAPHVWGLSETYFRTTQNEDGGWGYSHNQRRDSYGSMTAAGLSSMTVVMAARALGRTPDLDVIRANPVVARGRRWLAENLDVATNPGVSASFGGRAAERRGRPSLTKKNRWPLYWLWSLERAGRLLDVARFGEHDWYREGARRLVDVQRDDGRWVGSNPEYATSFALLFLTRGTKPVSTEPITGPTTTPR